MLHAIRQVLGGQIYLSGKMSVRILDVFAGGRQQSQLPIARLTDANWKSFSWSAKATTATSLPGNCA